MRKGRAPGPACPHEIFSPLRNVFFLWEMLWEVESGSVLGGAVLGGEVLRRRESGAQ